jgi:hypothetical protein
LNSTETRQQYDALRPGDRVEIVHRVQLGSRATESHTAGTVVSKGQREGGVDSGYRRWSDERQWFQDLVLRKADGELTTVTIDEFTALQRLD